MQISPALGRQSFPGPMEDLAKEQAHWRRCYPHHAFFSARLQFERYLPTFAFARKVFASGRSCETGEVPARLCSVYKDSVSACDRIDWEQAEMIISATWARMEAATQRQGTSPRRYEMANYSTHLPAAAA